MENIVTSSGTWDLSALLTNTEDPRIDEIIEATEKLISDFVAKYYGKIKLENNSPSLYLNYLDKWKTFYNH